jgi:prepilin-type N-terminal cleavage/methylation domain-containing protein
VRRRGASGFTLIEVLVALVVAVAAMSLVSQGFTTGARASTASQFTTRAALLAQRVLADAEAGLLALGSSTSGKSEEDPDFAWELRSATVEPGLYEVVVTVAWEERSQERTFVLHRLLRERPATP